MASKERKPGKVALWEMSYSHHCIKARKVLDHKGIAYERIEVPYHDKRSILKATGQDYVPWLVWDGKGVVWSDLVDFVEKQVPTPTAFPGGLVGQARILEHWAHDILEERVWRFVLPDMPATFKDEHERWVFEELQERKRGVPIAHYKDTKYKAAMHEHLAMVEQALQGRDWLLGDAPGLADFAVFGALHPLAHVGKEVPREFPKVRAWHQRVAKV